MILASFNGSNVSIDFNKKTFEFGKSKYFITAKVTYNNSGTSYIQTAKWSITPNVSSNNIPALRIARGTPDSTGTPVTFNYLSSVPRVIAQNNIRLGASSGVFTGISRIQLVESGGSGSRLSIGDIYFSGNIFDDNTDVIVNYEIDSEIPIFIPDYDILPQTYGEAVSLKNLSNCDALITNVSSGDATQIVNAVNYYNVTNSILSDKTYFIRSSLKVNGTPTSHKDYCFQILPDAKICLYQDDTVTGDGSPNLHLIISQYPCLVKGYSDPDSAYTESSNPDTEYWHSGYWRDIDTGVNYTGVCSTNIPIFRGQENAQKYLDGDLSESDALNGGSFANTDSTIGGELTGSDIPTINLSASGVGCYTYAVSEAQLKDIMANYLFTTDANLQQSIKDALWTWGNNPIDFMIDCYYVPFSITAFYDTINANLKFGTYQFPNTSYPAVKESNGNRLTLFNTTFEGVYGDWRDYTQFTYDLYLPFVGFFTLDNYKYLNHTVKCEMMFDLSTHNVRYYLFVDGIITDRVDGSVGVNIPLMATDTVNKAKHDRETKYGLVNDSLKLAGSVGQLAAGDIGGAVSGVNTVISGIKKYEDLQTKPTSSVEGSFSSSMNIYDISYAYLRITEKQLILPDKLNQLYNYPSYYMGSASQLSGYCEISDIRLNGFTGTVEEMEELKRDLMEGVIL